VPVTVILALPIAAVTVKVAVIGPMMASWAGASCSPIVQVPAKGSVAACAQVLLEMVIFALGTMEIVRNPEGVWDTLVTTKTRCAATPPGGSDPRSELLV
jgi:hypothetical protein